MKAMKLFLAIFGRKSITLLTGSKFSVSSLKKTFTNQIILISSDWSESTHADEIFHYLLYLSSRAVRNMPTPIFYISNLLVVLANGC